jgi:hypothetical protein
VAAGGVVAGGAAGVGVGVAAGGGGGGGAGAGSPAWADPAPRAWITHPEAVTQTASPTITSQEFFMLPRLTHVAGTPSTPISPVRVRKGRSRVDDPREGQRLDGEPEAGNPRPTARELWLCAMQTCRQGGATAYACIVTDPRDCVWRRAGPATCECVLGAFGGGDGMTRRSADGDYAVPSSRNLRMGLASGRLWR